jgi:hypothetical protein
MASVRQWIMRLDPQNGRAAADNLDLLFRKVFGIETTTSGLDVTQIQNDIAELQTDVETAQQDAALLYPARQTFTGLYADLLSIPAPIDAIDGLTPTADKLAYYTGATTAALTTLTAAARTLLDDATTGDMLTTLGAQPLDADLTALAALSSTGLVTRTAANTYALRTLTGPAAGLTVSNGDGVSGNPTLALANDLAALEALSGTDTIYYRSGVSTWSAVTIGTGLLFSGGTLSATGGGGVTDGDKGDITVTSSGATWTIDNDVVTFAKMQNIATDRLIGRDTASSGDPEELTVGGGLEFTGSGGIQRSALTGDVTASAGSNGTTIPNDTVTYAKMQNVSAASRILGRKTASAGDPEECTLSDVLDFIGSAAQGDILYRSASGWARLAAGTASYVLKTQGSGADPIWSAPASLPGVAFVGAMVKKSADQTGANYTTITSIAWDAEIYDTDGFHDNVTNNTRFTIPSGGDGYYTVGVAIRATNVTTSNYLQLALLKNGSLAWDGSASQYVSAAANSPTVATNTGPVLLVAGDYVEAQLLSAADTSIDITASRSNFWIQKVGQ